MLTKRLAGRSLGTPQGLSVYMDGVRLNQPFGDVVSWDLIPRVGDLPRSTLMPGSNPLFGLNTLGGALAMQTKDGSNDPGTRSSAATARNDRAQRRVRDTAVTRRAGSTGIVAGNHLRRGRLARRLAVRRQRSCSASSAGAARHRHRR